MMSSDMNDELEGRVRQSMGRWVETGDGVLVAVSGGSDSMGLLVLLAALRESLGLRLAVGFVDHGLRPGVDQELALVRRTAKELEVAFGHRRIPEGEVADAAGDSLQAWARGKRYRLLAEMAREQGMTTVATGHTRDDQAETVMLRLLRGSGIDGLMGIREHRELEAGISLVRPLLAVGRTELRELLTNQGISWAEDPSNQNHRFLRVRVRRELLPLMEEMQPGISSRLSALAGDAEAVVSYLSKGDYISDRVFLNLRLCSGIKVSHDVFAQLPKALWGRVVREAIRRVQGDLQRVSRAHISPLNGLIEERKSTDELPFPGEISVHVDQGSLFVFKGPLPPAPTGSGQPSATGAGLWKVRFAALGAVAEVRASDREHVAGIEMRARRPGDRVYGSHRKLKEIFIRARVPRPYRNFVPVLALDDQVISCPGIMPSRMPEVLVNWLLDEHAPFLDVDFAG